MFGVVQGCVVANDNRVQALNVRISKRNEGSPPFVFSPRPVATKYVMPLVDERPASVPIRASSAGYMGVVDVESELKNINFALQDNPVLAYVPSSASDLYETEVPSTPYRQPHPFLFSSVVGPEKHYSKTKKLFYNTRETGANA